MFPDLAGQSAGVDVIETDDIVFFEECVDCPLTAEVAGAFAPLPDDISFDV